MRTKNDIKKEWEDNIKDIITDLIEYEFNDLSDSDILVNSQLNNRDDFNARIEETLFEYLNDHQDIIYTYKAKEIINIINLYDVFDEWELTGERFKDYSSCAFANLYDFIQNEISINDLITKHFADKYVSS
jgi:hypothetical protein|tara:strand:- start:17 stop:409 length:393 start_codon:yes stop_codon:yes gene_type:complete